MASSLRIVLIEDSDDLRDLLCRDITRGGYLVECAECGESLDELSSYTAFDLLILDLNLPGEDGLSIAQRYRRANPDSYIIMLTARGRLEDKVVGYESGADLYLTKPIASAELMAAIKSVERRLYKEPAGFQLVLNVLMMTLTGEKSVELNRQEVAVLKALSESASGSLPYYRLLELCGETVVDETAKATLEVRIVRLRKKLTEVGVEGKGIRAIRSEGYQLLQQVKVV